MKRVVCLYRVSTKSQVDFVDSFHGIEEDIPVQRIACHQFCEEKKWTIVREYQESAISAYFTPTFGREAIQDILAAARNHDFDILLVFTLDRLSRRDYEFPMLIEQMSENGITVWSVKDGECAYRTSTERLLVYLAGWRASCESERLGERVKAAHSQMVSRGEYRGGPVPFGYRLVELDRKNKRGYPKHDLVRNDAEAEVVRMIFSKIVHEGYSVHSLSRFLQTYPFAAGVRKQNWRRGTINTMLRNPIYIGCMKFNNEISLPFERLQIVDPEVFQAAKAITHARQSKANPSLQYPSVQAAPCYHDLVWCDHCGSPLVFTHAFQKNRGGISIRYLYRCHNKSRFSNICNGASTYSSIILDAKIRAYIDYLASVILGGDTSAMLANAIEQERSTHLANKQDLLTRQRALDEQITATQEKIASSLRQFGIAATTPLELLYRDLCAKKQVLMAEIEAFDQKPFRPDVIAKDKTSDLVKLRALFVQYLSLKIEEAEQMIPVFVNRIYVSQGYHLRCELKPSILDFVYLIAENEPLELPDGSSCSPRIGPSAEEVQVKVSDQ